MGVSNNEEDSTETSVDDEDEALSHRASMCGEMPSGASWDSPGNPSLICVSVSLFYFRCYLDVIEC